MSSTDPPTPYAQKGPPPLTRLYDLAITRLQQEKERHAAGYGRCFVANAGLIATLVLTDRLPGEGGEEFFYVPIVVGLVGIFLAVVFFFSLARMSAFIHYWQAQVRAIEMNWATAPSSSVSIYAPYLGEYKALWPVAPLRFFHLERVSWWKWKLKSNLKWDEVVGAEPKKWTETTKPSPGTFTIWRLQVTGSTRLETWVPLFLLLFWLVATSVAIRDLFG